MLPQQVHSLPELPPPDGLVVGIKLVYDDVFNRTHEQIIFVAIGDVPRSSLTEYFQNLHGYVNIGERGPIFPEEVDIQ